MKVKHLALKHNISTQPGKVNRYQPVTALESMLMIVTVQYGGGGGIIFTLFYLI